MTYTLKTRLFSGYVYMSGRYADKDMALMNARMQNAVAHSWGGRVLAVCSYETQDVIQELD